MPTGVTVKAKSNTVVRNLIPCSFLFREPFSRVAWSAQNAVWKRPMSTFSVWRSAPLGAPPSNDVCS